MIDKTVLGAEVHILTFLKWKGVWRLRKVKQTKKNPAIYTIQGNMSLDFHEGKFVYEKVRF